MPVSRSDLEGAVQASADAVLGVTDVVESAHATIARPWRRERRTRGVSRWVYRSVRAVTRGVARVLGVALAARPGGPVRESASRDAVVAVLNGAFGDALEAEGNPLAFPTELRYRGAPFEPEAAASVLEGATGTLLLMVHGLCMHDGRWGDAEHDTTAELARGLGATPVGVRYNSGRHVSQNGRDLAGLIDRLAAAWPGGLGRVVIVAHSMGGLVARSALEAARRDGQGWLGLEVDLVTLGTPHHGAPLERLGSVVDGLLGLNRFFEPYARLGKARSAGVTDLRFGNVLEDDWAGLDRFERGPDRRRHVPLPDDVRVYTVAASPSGTALGDRTVGDGLVPLDSALGRHPDPARDLEVAPGRQWVAAGLNHFDLVRSPAVTARVLEWLAPTDGR